jgi:L-iditol 2-dehydrogenase
MTAGDASRGRPDRRAGAARWVRRVAIDAPGTIRVERIALPAEPPPGQVRLRTIAAGVCGSDLHVLAGHHPFVSYPVFPGHEVVARVERLGDGVDLSWQDERVALEPSLACGACDACARGSYNICDSLRVMGFQEPGGMADAFDAPADRLHRLPDSLSDEAAVLVEPTAVASHALGLAGDVGRARVAVVGAGTIGLLCAQVARASGAAVRVVDIDGERLAAAESLGLAAARALPQRGCDLVVECVGNEPALRAAIAMARKGGTVLVVGVHGHEPRIQAGLVQDYELRLQGSLMYTGRDYRQAVTLLESGAVDPAAMVSARVPLENAAHAFAEAARGGGTLKVLLKP